MKLAIMQPYFFPYLGYFQLLKAVDKFVVYDDVNFIKRGWINRNNILVNCKAHRFTIPLRNASQFELISKTKLASGWRNNLLKTIHHAYKKAPNFEEFFPILEKVFEVEHETIAELAIASILSVIEYLDLPLELCTSSVSYDNRNLKGQDRILDICSREACSEYYNLPGGERLYDPQAFSDLGINLVIIQTSETPYQQFGCDFVSRLSIIDVLMFNSKKTVNSFLDSY